MMGARPDWCLDQSCTPHSMSQDRRDGGSGFCCGQTAEPMVTERQGIRHENDGHFCVKSPRGIVMLEINREDLQVIARHSLRSMLARDPEAVFPPSWYTGRPFWPVPPPPVRDPETVCDDCGGSLWEDGIGPSRLCHCAGEFLRLNKEGK